MIFPHFVNFILKKEVVPTHTQKKRKNNFSFSRLNVPYDVLCFKSSNCYLFYFLNFLREVFVKINVTNYFKTLSNLNLTICTYCF